VLRRGALGAAQLLEVGAHQTLGEPAERRRDVVGGQRAGPRAQAARQRGRALDRGDQRRADRELIAEQR
jgi:hypothetical protein